MAASPKFVDFSLELVPEVTNKRDFQIAMLGFSWTSDPDQETLWASENTRPGGFNGMDYKNPELDRIMNQAIATNDRGRRKQLYRQMQQILAEDLPAPVLFFPKTVVATSRHVHGYTLNAFVSSTKRLFAKDVWVSTNQ